jgi:hypothetical protein
MKKIVTTPPVDIALDSLDEASVRRVNAWFDRLRNWDKDSFVRGRSHSLEEIPGVYVLFTSTDLRIFFKIDGDTITIVDIAKQSTILASARSPKED